MKTYNKYIALAALTLSLAACEQEDFTPTMDGDAVKINAAIGNMQTRVSYSGDNSATSFTNGDAIKVVNIERTSKNEATYTTDGENWTTTDAFVWNSGTDKNNQFNAWYPVAEYSSYDTFTIPTDQSDATKLASADWMTVSTEEMAKPANGVLDLTFEHRLAKVTVTVTEETLQFSDPSLKSAVIYSLAAENVTVASDDNGIAPLQVNESVTAIVCPGKYDSGTTFMKVTITDADNDYELNVPVNSYLTETGLTGGKHYTFDLKVGKDIVSIGKVMVADWNNGGTIDGGVAEEVIPNTFDATAMTPEQLNAAVTKALEYGHTELAITLAADADATMFSAITSALAADGIEEGSIDLTISGAKTVPECTFYVDEYMNENWRAGAALRSVTLTDATTIGESAFFSCAMTGFSAPNVIEIEGFALEACMKLTDVYLHSVQTLGDAVFSDCYALKTISLPECIDLGNGVFNSCEALETVYAPKATNLGAIEFMMCTSLMKVTLGSVVSVNQIYESSGLFDDANDTRNIDLVLSSEQKVMTFNRGTNYWTATETDYNGSDDHNNKSFIGYTFKSVTLQE